jgi:hypothetical protein
VDALTISIATVATTTFIVTVTEATMIGYVDFRSHFRINPAIPYLLCSTFLSKASVTPAGAFAWKQIHRFPPITQIRKALQIVDCQLPIERTHQSSIKNRQSAMFF